MKRIGIISDTHGTFDDTLREFLKDVDEIWHAGDIGSLELADTIASFKPLRAVSGNIDGGLTRRVYPDFLAFECEGVRVLMTHIGGYPRHYDPRAAAKIQALHPKLFIAGHSHILKVVYDPVYDLLHVNPGAAGEYGFHKVRTAVRLVIDGAVTYSAVLPRRAELPAEVSLTLTEERGYAGGAAIDGPVKLVCGAGRYTAGDWCRNDALRTYSGAAWYGRDFTLTKKPAGRVTLDLGEVVSTARVLVNGREAGLRLTSPWRFDVTGLLQEGANRIEIRVCNTTANIFLSSPTVYRGDTKAGILGPVRIEIAE